MIQDASCRGNPAGRIIEVSMMKKAVTSRVTVIITAICAIIWSIVAVMGVIYQTYNDSVFLFALNILCAVLWTVDFFVNLKRYRSKQGKEVLNGPEN